ncbi:hypothetical protein DFH07DRAFT_776631 [Mycena maculata]|uniref:Uncharacterized protein n=1 Tax=Mycena maculata TaxID=230809 RepID=A0AAD7ILK5_9AGAR|nr:hypothetical protein DFH07DRAFT_776631 [Mycena maculata]
MGQKTFSGLITGNDGIKDRRSIKFRLRNVLDRGSFQDPQLVSVFVGLGLPPVPVATVPRHPCHGYRARAVEDFARSFTARARHGYEPYPLVTSFLLAIYRIFSKDGYTPPEFGPIRYIPQSPLNQAGSLRDPGSEAVRHIEPTHNPYTRHHQNIDAGESTPPPGSYHYSADWWLNYLLYKHYKQFSFALKRRLATENSAWDEPESADDARWLLSARAGTSPESKQAMPSCDKKCGFSNRSVYYEPDQPPRPGDETYGCESPNCTGRCMKVQRARPDPPASADTRARQARLDQRMRSG